MLNRAAVNSRRNQVAPINKEYFSIKTTSLMHTFVINSLILPLKKKKASLREGLIEDKVQRTYLNDPLIPKAVLS